MKFTLPLAIAALASSALAFNYTIGVGKDEVTGLPGVGFDPVRTVVTNDGDLIIFSFLQGPHQVVQSSFGTPCSSSGGFNSGLVTVPTGVVSGGPFFVFTVANVSNPLYFFDAGVPTNGTEGYSFCSQGAVFCVNTNESDSTASCAAYQAAALALGAAEGVTTSIRSNSPSSSATSSSASATRSSNTTSSATGTTSSASATNSKSAAGRVEGAWGAGFALGALGLVSLVL